MLKKYAFHVKSDPFLSQLKMDAVTHQCTFSRLHLRTIPNPLDAYASIVETPMLRRAKTMIPSALDLCAYILEKNEEPISNDQIQRAKRVNHRAVIASFWNVAYVPLTQDEPQHMVCSTAFVKAYEDLLDSVHEAVQAKDVPTNVCLEFLQAVENHVQVYGEAKMATKQELRDTKLADLLCDVMTLESQQKHRELNNGKTTLSSAQLLDIAERVQTLKEDLIVAFDMSTDEIDNYITSSRVSS